MYLERMMVQIMQIDLSSYKDNNAQPLIKTNIPLHEDKRFNNNIIWFLIQLTCTSISYFTIQYLSSLDYLLG